MTEPGMPVGPLERGRFRQHLWPQSTPEPIKDGSPTSLEEKLIKIGAKVVSHERDVGHRLTEVAIAERRPT